MRLISSLSDEPLAEDDGELGLGLEPLTRRPSSAALLRTRYSNLMAASSFGKWPRVRTARRSLAFSASIAFVTGMKLPAPKSPLSAKSLRRMVRPSGTEAPGARKCGQADLLDELRARVSSWPPLRLARRRLTARRYQIVRHRTRIKNEVHAILHAHLIPKCPHADLLISGDGHGSGARNCRTTSARRSTAICGNSIGSAKILPSSIGRTPRARSTTAP